MNKKLRIGIGTAAVVALISGSSAQDGGVLLLRYTDMGRCMEHWIPASLAKEQPSWNPFTDAPSLSIARAVTLGHAYVVSPHGDAIATPRLPLSVQLVCGGQPGACAWHYWIHFAVPLGADTRYYTGKNHAVVLFDGSVVEPRPCQRITG